MIKIMKKYFSVFSFFLITILLAGQGNERLTLSSGGQLSLQFPMRAESYSWKIQLSGMDRSEKVGGVFPEIDGLNFSYSEREQQLTMTVDLLKGPRLSRTLGFDASIMSESGNVLFSFNAAIKIPPISSVSKALLVWDKANYTVPRNVLYSLKSDKRHELFLDDNALKFFNFRYNYRSESDDYEALLTPKEGIDLEKTPSAVLIYSDYPTRNGAGVPVFIVFE